MGFLGLLGGLGRAMMSMPNRDTGYSGADMLGMFKPRRPQAGAGVRQINPDTGVLGAPTRKFRPDLGIAQPEPEEIPSLRAGGMVRRKQTQPEMFGVSPYY